MATRRGLLLTLLKVLVTLAFVAANVGKITHYTLWQDMFAGWGYPRWGVAATTIVECIGVVALWVPALTHRASLLLGLIMCGAAYTWLANGMRIKASMTPLVIAALLLIIASLTRHPAALKQPGTGAARP